MDKEERKKEIQGEMAMITARHRVTGVDYIVAVVASIAENNPRIRQQEAYKSFIKRQVEASKDLEVLRTELVELEEQ